MVQTYIILTKDVFEKLMEITGADSPEEAVKTAVEHYLKCTKR